MSIGDILEILPFEDPIVVLEIDGAMLWDALEGSLSMWPAQEGSVLFIGFYFLVIDNLRQTLPDSVWIPCLLGLQQAIWATRTGHLVIKPKG